MPSTTHDDLQTASTRSSCPRTVTVLNLDWKQQGVGGDDSWGAWPHDPYLIPVQNYSYRFLLHPLAVSEAPERIAGN